MNLLDSRRTSLELGDLRDRIELRIRQLIYRQLLAPVIRDENRIGSNRSHNKRGKLTFTTTRDHPDTFAVVDLEFHRGLGMSLDVRVRTLLDQESDTSWWIAGEILINDASARENQRELFIGNFLRRVVFERVKLCLAIRMIETFFEQSRRAWMIFSWTRPEDPVVLFDL